MDHSQYERIGFYVLLAEKLATIQPELEGKNPVDAQRIWQDHANLILDDLREKIIGEIKNYPNRQNIDIGRSFC